MSPYAAALLLGLVINAPSQFDGAWWHEQPHAAHVYFVSGLLAAYATTQSAPVDISGVTVATFVQRLDFFYALLSNVRVPVAQALWEVAGPPPGG